MSTMDLFDTHAQLGDDDEDEDFDEETGETREKSKRNGGLDDSSEEEEEEDDEEAAQEVAKDFIVEEDEEDEDRAERRRERRKRRREEREREDEGLDEEDLDLIGEANPEFERRISPEAKFKRIKRGHKSDRDQVGPHDMFDDDEEDDMDYGNRSNRHDRLGIPDELDDFIEQDVDSEDEVGVRMRDGDSRPSRRDVGGLSFAHGDIPEEDMAEFHEAFGDGTDYAFALEMEEQEEEEEGDETEKRLELKDVFEPSQLADKLMTEEDNEIRLADEPERFQLDRKPYRHVVLTEEQLKEEALWISNMLLPTKRFETDMREPFQKAVAKVLEFMINDYLEVPFIFQHRKDYLIHAVKVPLQSNSGSAPGVIDYEVNATKLLNQTDLWDIYEYDLKFRALIDKRNALQKTYDNLTKTSDLKDNVFLELLPAAETMEELQDIQEYLHFQYAAQLKDAAATNGAETNGTQRRPRSQKGFFERIRASNCYRLVKAFGITADAFAQNILRGTKRQYTEDPALAPDEMADGEDVLDGDFTNSIHAWKSAKAMFTKEISTSPRMRKVMRGKFYEQGVFDCFRTEKGLRKIDEQHPYYEFKYLRNLRFEEIARQPDLYVRMLKAEEEGLIEVRVRLQNYEHLQKRLYSDIQSDNQSTVADAWNKARREVIDVALQKLEKIISRGVKETLRTVCEDHVAKFCREEFSKKLDQAPFKPKGMELGTVPRVLALSNGDGVVGRDPISWVYVEENGRVLENGKFGDLSVGDPERGVPDGVDVPALVELVERRKPDVIGVSGFSTETRKLFKHVNEIVEIKDLRGTEYEDPDNEDETKTDKIDVVIVNDEVARLYQSSDRAKSELPGFAPTSHYCVAIAKYLQDPLKEYASLGRDITSITFHKCQNLVPEEKIKRQLESALVDMVNLVGVDINEAVSDLRTANLLGYVCGLGPRKAQHVLKAININGGVVESRQELLGQTEADPELFQAVGPKVFTNCASFLYIDYDRHDPSTDYLDNTRVHPEDYDIGKKMAADALELDEEDIKAETDENGPGAIVRKLILDDAQDKVNDLILEEYAEQLEQKLNQRKRATLETIRAELQSPYEELRRPFTMLSTDEIFTMFTGETRDSLPEGAIVAMSIKRITDDHIDGKLDCGVDANVPEVELTDKFSVPIKSLYSLHQTVQVKLLYLNRKSLSATVSLREEQLARPYRKHIERMRDEWDDRQEAADKELLREKADVTGRTQRVIKHPNFRPFNAAQAEEYLGSQNRGDVVIRPSSKGIDHLAVTWKVADGIFQHIDVLEMNKENQFSLGKTLKIGGKYTYSDLDELIVNHVKAMAKKVDEMTLHEKYQSGTKADTERWLTTYLEANPRRSMYAFCINPKYPGYFHLCFKAGELAPLQNWPVKVIPQGYELQRIPYPDMRALCNGFKIVFANMQKAMHR